MAWHIVNDRPVYIQLMERLKEAIMRGEYPPGSRVPPVRDLAREAGVNPNTMQKALQELEREGVMYSNRTAGRFVTEDLSLLRQSGNRQAMEYTKAYYEKMIHMGYDRTAMTELLLEYEQQRGDDKKE